MLKTHTFRLTIGVLAIGAGVVLNGCNKANNDADRSGRTEGQSIQGSASKMSDGNIVAKLSAADSFEVSVGKLALTRAADKRVKDYAKMLINDHTQHGDNIRDLADRQGIRPSPPENDSSAAHMAKVMKRLRSAGKGAKFDRAFMEAMVQDHQKDVEEARQMASATGNDALKQQLNQTVPKLQEHLDHARDLADQLGARGGAAQAGGSQGGRNRNGR